jgi:hypothetical protein
MRLRILRSTFGVLLALLLAAPVQAQLQAPNRRDVVERVADRCPGLILHDHAFTDAVATLLNGEDARWGRNGKRGNANDPSHDAIAYRNPASPFGVSVVDIIGSAGSPSASPAWIDQTQATIDARTTGVWVAPSGRLPACLTGGAPPPGTGPGPVDPPPVTPPLAGNTDLAAVQRDLAALLNTLSSIQARLDSKASKDDIETVYRLIADQVIAAHFGEQVERVADLQRQVAELKQVVDRIAASRILRF